MRILRADHLGFCFGVRDALRLALDTVAHTPVTILGELVHNPTVLASLRARGIRVETDLDRVVTDTVLITAHGTSDRRRAEVRRRALQIFDATCPLVNLAHRAVASLVAGGYHPVIVGKRDHVEVRGLTDDLAAFDVILDEADVAALLPRPRFGVVAQTTQPIERVRQLVSALRRRFPEAEVRLVDTVCQPTKLRQHAAVELAQRCDVVIVIGGVHSNNTRELVTTCQRHCACVRHIQSAAELQADWFGPADIVGITAGTSTPDETIAEVERWLLGVARSREPQAVADLSCHVA
jgi:4-hydroxy-3-methylbut-2-enyl diphosphate reductase